MSLSIAFAIYSHRIEDAEGRQIHVSIENLSFILQKNFLMDAYSSIARFFAFEMCL